MKEVTDPQIGDIGFKVGDDLFGRIISALTTKKGGKIAPSHVFVVGPRDTLFESWLWAREQPLSKYDSWQKRGRVRFVRPNASVEAKTCAYHWMVRRYAGVWYEIIPIIGHLFPLFGKKNPFRSKQLVCHEVALYYLQRLYDESRMSNEKSDLIWAAISDPEDETPQSLLDKCLSDGKSVSSS
jgi:hypothetical protein